MQPTSRRTFARRTVTLSTMILLAACGAPVAATPTARRATDAAAGAAATTPVASGPAATASSSGTAIGTQAGSTASQGMSAAIAATATPPAPLANISLGGPSPAASSASSPASDQPPLPAPAARPVSTATGAGQGSNLAAAPLAVPSCVLRPAQTEGPYFVDEKLNRADIRADSKDGSVKPGVPLKLSLRVLAVAGSGCAPLPGATVDIWHCDAAGQYSDVRDGGAGFDTRGKTFLRGFQISDAGGLVTFQTIYPGWYRGRAVHIHFKVRTGATGGASQELTSQLYFDDALSDQVFAQPPYAAQGAGRLKNSQDGIFRQGGSQLLVPIARESDGYSGLFDIGLRMA